MGWMGNSPSSNEVSWVGRFTTWVFAVVAPFFFFLGLFLSLDAMVITVFIYAGVVTSFFATFLMPYEIKRSERLVQKAVACSLFLFNGIFLASFAYTLLFFIFFPGN